MKSRFKIPGAVDTADASPKNATARVCHHTNLDVPLYFDPPPYPGMSNHTEVQFVSYKPVLFELGRCMAETNVFFAVEFWSRAMIEAKRAQLDDTQKAAFAALSPEALKRVELQAFNNNCRSLLEALFQRHITGGCGEELCDACGNEFDPDTSKATIQLSLDTQSAITTRFRKFMPGYGLMFATNAERTRTDVSVFFDSPGDRAMFERRVLDCQANHAAKGGAQ